MDKTIPWRKEELVFVNGVGLWYSVQKGDMIIRFPGGRSEPLHEVQSWATVVLPEGIRK